MAEQAPPPQGRKSNTGGLILDEKLGAVLAYFFSLFSALFVICLEKQSRYVYFHGWQSLFIWCVYIPIMIVFRIIDVFILAGFAVLSFIWWVLWAILWIFCMVMAWQRAESGNYFKLPLLGNLAESQMLKKFGPASGANVTMENQQPQQGEVYYAQPPPQQYPPPQQQQNYYPQAYPPQTAPQQV